MRSLDWFTIILVTLVVSTGQVQSLTDSKLSSDLFYPFGTDEGDTVVPPNIDDSGVQVTTAIAFPFYNASYTTLYVGFIIKSPVIQFDDV
jgi:hypothetical protein